MFPYRRFREALGAFLWWLQEVADLTLAITQLIFGAILLWAVGYGVSTGHFNVLAHAVAAFAFIICLRIVIAPAPFRRH